MKYKELKEQACEEDIHTKNSVCTHVETPDTSPNILGTRRLSSEVVESKIMGFPGREKRYLQNVKSTFRKLISTSILDETLDLKEQICDKDNFFWDIDHAISDGTLDRTAKAHANIISDIAQAFYRPNIEDMGFNEAFTRIAVEKFHDGEVFQRTVVAKKMLDYYDCENKPSLSAITSYFDIELVKNEYDLKVLSFTTKRKKENSKVYSLRVPCQKTALNWLSGFDQSLGLKGGLSKKVRTLVKKKPVLNKKKETYPELDKSVIDSFNEYSTYKKGNGLPKGYTDLDLPLPMSARWSQDNAGIYNTEASVFIHVKKAVFVAKTYMGMSPLTYFELFNPTIIRSMTLEGKKREVFSSTLKAVKWFKQECGIYTYTRYYGSHILGIDQEEWYQILNEVARACDESAYDLNLSIKADERDFEGERNVRFILRSEDPFGLFKDIESELYNQISIEGNGARINRTRDWLIYRLSLDAPLRESAWTNMKYHEHVDPMDYGNFIDNKRTIAFCRLVDNKGSFLSYSIVIGKNAPKNRYTKSYNGQTIDLSGYEDSIEFFLNERNIALSGNSSDYLFFSSISQKVGPARVKKVIGEKLNKISTFYNSSHTAIQRVFPDKEIVNGINHHGLRHLVGSLYLVLHPGDYEGAAMLLGDTVKTVMEIYTHPAEILIRKNIKSFSQDVWNSGI